MHVDPFTPMYMQAHTHCRSIRICFPAEMFSNTLSVVARWSMNMTNAAEGQLCRGLRGGRSPRGHTLNTQTHTSIFHRPLRPPRVFLLIWSDCLSSIYLSFPSSFVSQTGTQTCFYVCTTSRQSIVRCEERTNPTPSHSGRYVCFYLYFAAVIQQYWLLESRLRADIWDQLSFAVKMKLIPIIKCL